jgi:hypothetical protein
MTALRQLDNPILWQEITHQERSAPRWMRWEQLAGILVALLTVIFLGSTLNSPEGYPTTLIMLYCVWLIHMMTAIRAIVAGSNAISREHVGATWDALMLTGVSARKVMFGKWRAALYRVRGWMLLLGIVRLASLPIYILALTRTYAWYMCGGSTSYGSVAYCGVYPTDFSWVPWAAALSVAMTVILTVLEVMCCTALGLATSAITRRGSLAAIVAIIIRFFPVMLFAGFTRYELGIASWRWWRFTPFALADGGTSPLMQLVLPLMPWTEGRHMAALPGLLLVTAMIVGLLLLSAGLALIVIRRTGALPHNKQDISTSPFSQASGGKGSG